MKKLLMIAALATLAMTAMAMPPDLKPPITTGGTGNTSTTEVRITANVVQGIAVNEASPIDFGNLSRGMYTGLISAMTPGKIHLKGAPNKVVQVKLDNKRTDLIWTGANGTDQTGSGLKETIDTVEVVGLDVTETPITLSGIGEATRILTASFTADPAENKNLGSNQRLGSYVGMVKVTATTTN